MSQQSSLYIWSGLTLLAAFIIWDFIEYRISCKYRKLYRPFLLPSPEERQYSAHDVSVIIPTVDTAPSFIDCLAGCLKSRPLEIIVVTTEDEEARVRHLLRNPVVAIATRETILQVLTVSTANKRDQLVRGINASKGRILALVDDDAFWNHEDVLHHLLAPFQEEDIGLVGGVVTSHLPERRKHVDIISPWEVAVIRLRGKRHDSMKSAYAGDGGINFCVSGVTALLRSEIARDPVFQDAFVNETFMGERQNSGDDSFITRWVLFQHLLESQVKGAKVGSPKQWRLGMQLTSGAEVATSVMPDHRFTHQLKRWYRSGLRHRINCLFYEPGFRAMYKTCPHMARKMVQGILNLPLLVIRLYCFWCAFRCFPWLAWLTMGWKLHRYIKGLLSWADENPWARRYLWAAVIVDHVYLVSDLYCWLTLGKEVWMTRKNVDDKHVAVVTA